MIYFEEAFSYKMINYIIWGLISLILIYSVYNKYKNKNNENFEDRQN